MGIEIAVEVVAGFAAERFEGNVPDAVGFFGDGEELGGLGAVIFAAGILPGGIGFEEKSVGWNLSEGFVQFAGGQGAAEGSAEGEVNPFRWEVESRSGHRVRRFSSIPGENEVLFNVDREFEVLFNGVESGQRVIRLKEIEHDAND